MAATDYQPRTAAGRAALRALRDGPADAVVGLDFDGTLAGIVTDPRQARPAAGAVEVLAALSAAGATVAIITGRPAATAVSYAGLDVLLGTAGLLVLGHYGDDRWDAATGSYVSAPTPAGLSAAREQLSDLLRDLGAPAGVAVEDKGTSLAVHVRGAAEPHGLFVRLAEPLRDLASRTGLAVQPGRLVHELRGRTSDKGAALRALVGQRQAKAVMYAGDDLGDLAAFDAVEVLRAEGVLGLTVACVGPEPVPEVTKRADLVLDGPAALVDLLHWLVGDQS